MPTKISNPLTIIAIFSGLAEGFATVALIQTPLEIQQNFVYFVMFFPTLIVLLFFGVLLFKNKSLYAPSDFENQEHYLKLHQIKESVNFEIDRNLRSADQAHVNFTEQQIEYVKKSVNQSLERAEPASRKSQVEAYLQTSPATVNEISVQLGLARSYTYQLLNELQRENKVESRLDGGSREKIWSTTY